MSREISVGADDEPAMEGVYVEGGDGFNERITQPQTRKPQRITTAHDASTNEGSAERAICRIFVAHIRGSLRRTRVVAKPHRVLSTVAGRSLRCRMCPDLPHHPFRPFRQTRG